MAEKKNQKNINSRIKKKYVLGPHNFCAIAPPVWNRTTFALLRLRSGAATFAFNLEILLQNGGAKAQRLRYRNHILFYPTKKLFMRYFYLLEIVKKKKKMMIPINNYSRL